ncbi:MAG: DNA-3-methyladenine glycosylase [Herpetosiphon sp.]
MQPEQITDTTMAIDHLRSADPILASLIDAVGPYRLPVAASGFIALVDAIISQQISVKAADTILQRLVDHIGQISPALILAQTVDSLRVVGLSGQKARYLIDLASRVHNGSLNLDVVAALPNEEVITQLTRVKGIGRWTAEMYLIFGLGRPDVLPVADLGLRQGIQRAYALPTIPDVTTVVSIGSRWRPYRSIATWYIWRSLTLSPPSKDTLTASTNGTEEIHP